MKVAIWGGPARSHIIDGFKGLHEFELVPCATRDELLTQIPHANALILTDGQFDPEVAQAVTHGAPALRFIQAVTAGYEGLQTHGVRSGIVVANAGDSWSPAVAEHAIALLLALCKQLPAVNANQRAKGWDRSFASNMIGLGGKTVAIIGYGSIAREIATRLKPFGTTIIGVSRSAKPEATADRIVPIAAINDAIAQADVVILTVPYSKASHHLFGPAQFAACKPSAILINTARGGVLDTDALIDALNGGSIAGAGLDVTDPEPLPADHPLWLCPNLIISPHVSGSVGEDGWRRLAATVLDNFKRFAAGEPLRHLVDVPQH